MFLFRELFYQIIVNANNHIAINNAIANSS